MRGQIGAHDAIAHPPAGHRVGFRKSIEKNRPTLEAGDRHNGMVFSFENEAAVDLVGKHRDVASPITSAMS